MEREVWARGWEQVMGPGLAQAPELGPVQEWVPEPALVLVLVLVSGPLPGAQQWRTGARRNRLRIP